MSKPATPGQEGPSYAPPANIPSGWIAQWDGVSKKYYYVQLSTGASQWDTPTQPAPTGPTPQATPQGGLDHPYGTPQDLNIVTNADGTQSIRHSDGTLEPYTASRGVDGDRSLSGNIGQFALNQLLGGKTSGNNSSGGGLGALAGQFLGGGSNNHQNNSSGGGGLGALAGQFLGGGSNHSGGNNNNNSAASGLTGALMSSFMHTGQKPEPSNYSGAQSHQSQGGFLGGVFGGGNHQSQSQSSGYGYSQQGSSQNGYTGTAPPTSYQPSGSTNTPYSPPPQQSHQGYSQNQSTPSYGSPQPPNSYGASQAPQQPYGAPPNSQQPYGASSNQPQHYGTPSNQPNPPYGAPPNSQQYGSGPPQEPPFGGVQHQTTFGGHGTVPPPSQQYHPPGGYQQSGQPPAPQGAPPGWGGPHSGNLSQPQHQHFQGLHNAEHSGGLYGNSGSPAGPPPPMGSRPNNSQPPYGQPPGGYNNQGRW